MIPTTTRWLIGFVSSVLLMATSAPLGAITFDLVPISELDLNKFDISLTVGISGDEDQAETTGTMEADLGWEVEGDGINITELSLTGGELVFTDLSFNIGILVNGTGLGGTVGTLSPPSAVTNGIFTAAEHEMVINQGVFMVTGAPDTDLSESPFGGSGSGDGTVAWEESSRVGNQVTYDVTLTLPISFIDSQPAAPGSPIFIDIEVDGVLQGVGQLDVILAQEDADFDVDGDVDGRDFLTWQQGEGISSGAALADGDANADGAVDALDLGIWQGQFNEPNIPAAVLAVPEPGTIMLVLGGFIAATCLLRRD